MAKVTPAVSDQSLEFIGKIFRKGNGQPNPSGGVTFLVEMFKPIFRQNLIDLKGKFEPAELKLMISALNGSILSPEFAGRRLVANVEDHMDLDGAAETFDVNRKDFMEELMFLSTPQLALLELWIQGFWSQSDDENAMDLDEYIKPLLA